MKYSLIIIALFLFSPALSQKSVDLNLQYTKDGWGLKVIQPEGDKTVLLIGNSVCNGFKDYLAKELPDYRVVAWINPYHLNQEHLYDDLILVLQNEKYNLIHFNIGLHGWEKGRIPTGRYQPLLQKYLDTLRYSCPEAKIIWASITPIMNKVRPFKTNEELNPVIEGRNKIASVVMKENGIPVNDLYALCLLNMEKAKGDRFHWNVAMYRMMALQTAAKILLELNTYHQ